MQGQVLPGKAAPTAGQGLLPAKSYKTTRAAARCTGRSGPHVTCAATLAQEQSAAAQDNGVGKAQAGTQLPFPFLCVAQQAVTLWPAGDRHQFSILNGSSPGMFCTAAQTYEASPPVAQRIAVVERQTKETKVQVSIGIDGTGKCRADTPIYFLNHMLDVSLSAVWLHQAP